MTSQTLFQRYHFSTTQKLEVLPRPVARFVNTDRRVVEVAETVPSSSGGLYARWNFCPSHIARVTLDGLEATRAIWRE